MERKLLEIVCSIGLIFLIALALSGVTLLCIFGVSLARGQGVDDIKVYPVLKPCLYETCHLSDTSHGAIANIPLPSSWCGSILTSRCAPAISRKPRDER